jgi:cellulose synthase/poly-beta-1,6-N-acetylglucosamine synthase-like glycosyltransferase
MNPIDMNDMGVIFYLKDKFAEVCNCFEENPHILEKVNEYHKEIERKRNAREEAMFAFKGIDFNRISHIVSRDTKIEIYMINDGKSKNMRKFITRKIRLVAALSYLSDFGFVQVTRFEIINTQTATFLAKTKKVRVGNNTYIEISKKYLEAVTKAFDK